MGSGVGMIGGLLFVRYINEIEKILSVIIGRKVFDDSIYYFDKIPTLVEPHTLIAIVIGLFSSPSLPASGRLSERPGCTP